MCKCTSDAALPFGYADDVSLWYEIDPNKSRDDIIADIKRDMAALKAWGDDNNTTFEKSKMEMVIVSNKRLPFDASGICFDGFDIPCRSSIKLVGYTIDSKLRWGPMVDRLAKKARARIGALRRIAHHLDSSNMKIMYSSFIRSIMEFGSVAWMGAAPTHLAKLDRVQDSAQRIGKFDIEPLGLRRQAAALKFGFKLLSGSCKGVLNRYIPKLHEPTVRSTRVSRHTLNGTQVIPVTSTTSLDTFKRGFHGILPNIWSKLPQVLVGKGRTCGWDKVTKRCVNHILRGDKNLEEN